MVKLTGRTVLVASILTLTTSSQVCLVLYVRWDNITCGLHLHSNCTSDVASSSQALQTKIQERCSYIGEARILMLAEPICDADLSRRRAC